MKIKFVYKGGAGSGNRGHSGRPGKVGGSSQRRMVGEINDPRDARWDSWLGSGYFIVNDEHIVDVGNDAHLDAILNNPEDMEAYGISQDVYDKIYNAVNIGEEADLDGAYRILSDATNKIIRVRSTAKELAIDTNTIDTTQLRRLHRLWENGKLYIDSTHKIVWGSFSDESMTIVSNLEEFLSAKYVVKNDNGYVLKEQHNRQQFFK